MNTIVKVSTAWKAAERISPFGSRIALTLGTNISMGMLALVTGTLAARMLGPEGRGELAAIQTWPGLIATFAMLGLPEALVYFSAREPSGAGRFLGSAMAMGLLMALPFVAVGYLLMPIFLAAQSPEVITFARWYLLLVPIRAVVGMTLHPLRGLNHFPTWNLLRTAPVLGWLAVLFTGWFVGAEKASFFAFGHLIMLATLFFPFFLIVSHRIPGPVSPALHTWKPMLRYGIPSAMISVPQTLNLRLDQMLMAMFLPARTLGIYVIAVAWSSMTNPVLSSVGIVLFPRVASKGTPAQQVSALAEGVRLGTLSAIILLIPMLGVTPWIIPLLFGSDFSPAVPAALVLVVASSIAGLNLILQEGLRGLGHPRIVMWSEFAGLAVTALALWFLLQPFQILGAAIASFLGYSAVTIYLVLNVKRLTGLSSAQLFLPTLQEAISIWKRAKVAMAGDNQW